LSNALRLDFRGKLLESERGFTVAWKVESNHFLMEYEQFLDKIRYLKSDFLPRLIADELGTSLALRERKNRDVKRRKSDLFRLIMELLCISREKSCHFYFLPSFSGVEVYDLLACIFFSWAGAFFTSAL